MIYRVLENFSLQSEQVNHVTGFLERKKANRSKALQ